MLRVSNVIRFKLKITCRYFCRFAKYQTKVNYSFSFNGLGQLAT